MNTASQEALKKELIETGKKLYERRLVVARSGNLSCRVQDETIFITATGTSLGNLCDGDIITVDLSAPLNPEEQRLTSEFGVHSRIYRNFKNVAAVIHCHPPMTNAYFAVSPQLKTLTLESKIFLGDIQVVEQDTPSITRPELVIEALKSNNLAVIRNHGVVAMADSFTNAFHLIETLEEAVKTVCVARLFKKDILDTIDKALKEEFRQESPAFPMFSPEHIQGIVDLVNSDEFIAAKGKELDLTLQLAVKLDGTDKAYRFNFEKGRIASVERDAQAPFVISAPSAAWEQVFSGKLDPFVAVTQGKMKLTGQLGQLSRWYVPFSRLFELFKQVPFK